MEFYQRIHTELLQFKAKGAYRFLKLPQADSNGINFASNDYLGLTISPDLVHKFDVKPYKLSASSSRLLSGNHQYYKETEDLLQEQYRSEAALYFNSGYHLNIGVLPSITTKNDLILADKLVHASLIESFKLTSAKVIRYRHLDYEQLENLLQKNKANFESIFIVSESLFSMDGDKVNLKRLVDLKKAYSAYLYLDEAHAVGVLGQNGLGLAEENNLMSEVDFLVGTMGKALASVGAYLICEQELKDYLVNTCRSLIYTTALPPVNLAWSKFVLENLSDFDEKRKQLKELSTYLKRQFKAIGVEIKGDAHILALIIGDNNKCVQLASQLEKAGIRVQAIRPPTVPRGTSRIRLSLHADLSFEAIDKLVAVISEKKQSGEI